MAAEALGGKLLGEIEIGSLEEVRISCLAVVKEIKVVIDNKVSSNTL